MEGKYDPITLGIHWNKLISITDEVFYTLIRTSFSEIVRDCWDLSCAILDPDGRGVAQSSFSIPSFIGTQPYTVKQFLKKLPRETLEPGDVLATNNPWIGSGHLHDITMAKPVFCNGELTAFLATTTHLPDIGGSGLYASGRWIYEEGLLLPICKIVKSGELNHDLFDVFENNVRVPKQVLGDIKAGIAANNFGESLMLDFIGKKRVDFPHLADFIIERSERTMRGAIEEIPRGIYKSEVEVGGGGDEIYSLRCRVEVKDSDITVDYGGTDKQNDYALNSPLIYTYAFSVYPIKCITTPELVNNEGCTVPIEVKAPEGCLLNPNPPAAVSARSLVGWFITSLVFRALSEVIPKKVRADSGMVGMQQYSGLNLKDRPYVCIHFSAGGRGAGSGRDGNSTTAFPTNMFGPSTEIFESETGMLVEWKEFIKDSGGPGKHRGGLGQSLSIRNISPHRSEVTFLFNRTLSPPLGLMGGQPSSTRKVYINDVAAHPKERYRLKEGDRVRLENPGGGGFGRPSEREVDLILKDIRNGYVSVEVAKTKYSAKFESSLPLQN